MDKEELKKGMDKADEKEADGKKADENEADEPKDGGGGEGWAPSLDWIMESVGPFFKNNKGLGELLLGKLNESGIDTETVALSGLVDVLQQFSREYKALGEAVGDNLERINELSSQSDDLARAVRNLVRELGGSTDNAPEIPVDGAGAEGMGADAGMPPPGMEGGMDAGLPPPGMEGGMDMGMPPPDMGGGMDMGVPPMGMEGGMDAGMPSPDMGGGMDMGAPPMGMAGGPISDERMKDARDGILSDENLKRRTGMSYDELVGVISDIRLKRNAKKVVNDFIKGQGTKLDRGIIDACSARIN